MPLSDPFDTTPPQLSPQSGTLAGGGTAANYAFAVDYNIALTAGAVPNGTFSVSYDGQYVILYGQTTASQNGVYLVNASGGAARASAMTVPTKMLLGGSSAGETFMAAGATGTPIYGPFGPANASPATKTPATNDSFDNTAPGTKTP
jgi:hypothetical protein